jgi:hypothetical protein
MLTLAFMAGAISILPSIAGATGAQPPSADAPPGWSSHEAPGGLHYFMPPGATNMDVYEAIFPAQSLNGTLEQTAAGIWHAIVGEERVVDSKAKRIRVSDGAPTDEVIVASVDARNEGVYRVFVVKQYGQSVAAGELRFDSVDRIKSIGKPAFDSLENMTASYQSITPYQAGTITPYHAGTITPLPSAGVDVAAQQGPLPAGLAGIWALKVPGVAYTTSIDYGAFTENTLHVSAGAAAGYLRITPGKRYVWYDGSGHAISRGRLVQVIPHRDARAGQSYWRVYEGREQHYLTLDDDGGISVYDTGTNMVSMEGRKH